MSEKQKAKYSSKNWQILSPNGKFRAVVTWNKTVSLKKMEIYFKNGWRISPLFPEEKVVAERRANRAQQNEE